jgi:hypothetical protein
MLLMIRTKNIMPKEQGNGGLKNVAGISKK